MRLLFVFVLVLAIAGCGGTTQKERAENAAQAKKVAGDTVKTMSGYNQIQAGERAKDRVRQASAQHQADLKDVEPEGSAD